MAITQNGAKIYAPILDAARYTEATTNTTRAAGTCGTVGDKHGVFLTDCGTSAQTANSTYPGGSNSLLVIECHKIVVPKVSGAGEGISNGSNVYWATNGTAASAAYSTGTLAGKANQTVATDAEEVEIDLRPMA